jgi:hypothetical protein
MVDAEGGAREEGKKVKEREGGVSHTHAQTALLQALKSELQQSQASMNASKQFIASVLQ